jgi:hypothetical protein
MTRNLARYAALLAVVGIGLSACEKTLQVSNPNSGDTKLVLGNATDAENLLGGYFKRWSLGVYNGTTGLTTVDGMTSVMSLMNFSSLANNCLNGRLPFAGADNFNTAGNVCTAEQRAVYVVENEVMRVASSFIGQVDGGLDLTSAARKNRDLAYAEFLRGVSIGYIALFYDSTAVISSKTDAQDPGKLVGYREAMDSANAALQRSIDYANLGGTGGSGFPLPSTWIPSPTTFTAAEFVKLVRSFRARFNANVARTATERNAAPWASIIADAQAGITADFQTITSNNTTSGTAMPNAWRSQYDGAGLWHQMPPFIIGMGDVSGNYQTWLATPLTSRGAGNNGFFMVTPDLRFPQGATRAAQQADFAVTSCQTAGSVCKRYFVNRPAGNDQYAGAGWGWSNYDFQKFHAWRVAGDAGTGQQGTTIYMSKTEIDMLQAEGLIRTGGYAAAAALINLTRVKNGLQAITAFDGTSPVPGGTSCVPQIPVAPSYTTTACGNMMEAMKWEKRIETAYTTLGPWYLDGRGWGDLPKDTPLFWATPNEDLLSRGKKNVDLYGVGVGVGDAPNSAAPKSTYGW